ncbi:MAG: TnpV protein [Clostridia bacterium]|nr:TnpV protein [Clostridia bacterium]
MASYFEQRGGTYTPVNGVLLPDLVLEAPPPGPLGKFGRMRKRYLEQRRDGTFTALVLSGKLTEHLLEVDQTARDQLAALTRQLAVDEGVTESLKARDQLEWLRHMNALRYRAEEIVISEIIYS